jgi:hypothetical protein
MPNKLLIHPHTKQQLEYFFLSPAQGLLITGSAGAGKTSVAFSLASQLLKIPESKEVSAHPYFIHIIRLKNKQDIAIEQVRELISKLRLKVAGDEVVKRVVFIEDAQFLSIPAQNALLKILEEPNADTIFILTATSARAVLPTIASRTQQITLQPVSLAAAQKFWDGYPPELVESTWRLSRGAPGLLNSLLVGEEHPLKAAVDDIKAYLRANKYEKIIFIDKLSRNREQFNYFLDALIRTLSVLHHQAVRKNQSNQAKILLSGRKLAMEAQKALEANANTRLIALNLSLNITV